MRVWRLSLLQEICRALPSGYGYGCAYPVQSQYQGMWFPTASLLHGSQEHHQDQRSNSFTLRFVSGNNRICQSRRSSLHSLDGSVPSPPLDLCVARLEKRPYWNATSSSWCVPSQETNSHYCTHMICIQLVFPSFISSSCCN